MPAPSLPSLHSRGLEAAHCTASAILTIVWDSCACRTGERELGCLGGEKPSGRESGRRMRRRDASTGGNLPPSMQQQIPLSELSEDHFVWSSHIPILCDLMHWEPKCVERCLTVGSVKAQKERQVQDLPESNSRTHNKYNDRFCSYSWSYNAQGQRWYGQVCR